MTQSSIRLRIGTRGQPLALAQSAYGAPAAGGGAARRGNGDRGIKVIRDHRRCDQDRPLSDVGGKGLFTKEIEQALLDGTIDSPCIPRKTW